MCRTKTSKATIDARIHTWEYKSVSTVTKYNNENVLNSIRTYCLKYYKKQVTWIKTKAIKKVTQGDFGQFLRGSTKFKKRIYSISYIKRTTALT